jgi:hypothetical protein
METENVNNSFPLYIPIVFYVRVLLLLLLLLSALSGLACLC